jgi:maltose alpha-D-glucosyltransferase/alpha-amylase
LRRPELSGGRAIIMSDSLWYKEAILYELHVRAFHDSDGDGIGDFKGITEKLDYLQDLGITAIWLLPFYPSPLKDDGYDIADFTDVHVDYGTLTDFKRFLGEAHARGIRVITELVLNHTSDEHPWFRRAIHAKRGSGARNFYVWSDTPDRYRDTRVIFPDFESSNWAWNPVAQAYYWHRFFSHQPDLNFDSPGLQRAMFRVLDFWLAMGVDGMRLDAVPYLYERPGTSCENLPETHQFLKKLRRYVDRKFKDRVFVGEANQWPEDAVAYFGDGDECQLAFHFPLMPRLFMALRMEDRFPIIDILDQTPPIPDNCQWALFLRNHDEMTLEMVTDEERDYMYRMYAYDPRARLNLGIRRRLAPLMGGNRRTIELLNALLFSLPGTPVIYYGDEIGMGDNIYLGDRNGVRTPMQWNSDRNAGFSRANSQRLYLPVITDPEYHYEAVNVEAQQQNPHSLLWWMKHIIAQRKRHKCLSEGTMEFLNPENRKVLTFLRHYGDSHILVVANLSRFVQYVDIDLSAYQGIAPVELFGPTPFPTVGASPYFLSLGPHSFYWFSLQREPAVELRESVEERPLPELVVAGDWTSLCSRRGSSALEDILPRYLAGRRWFAGKARRISSARVVSSVPTTAASSKICFTLIGVDYAEADPETYFLPLALATGDQAARVQEAIPHAALAQVSVNGKNKVTKGLLYDAGEDGEFGKLILKAVTMRRRFRGPQAEVVASRTEALSRLVKRGAALPDATASKAEQSNTSLIFGDKLILKSYRRVDEGVNPELDIGRFLTSAGFANAPPLVGSLEYRRGRGRSLTIAVMHGFVPNEGDAWKYTLDEVGHFYDRVLSLGKSAEEFPCPHWLGLEPVPEAVAVEPLEHIGAYFERAGLLGKRSAELHLALASDPNDPEFSPEPFTPFYQRSLRQSMRNLTEQAFGLLAGRVSKLPKAIKGDARKVLGRENEILRRFRETLGRKIETMRIRCHGDLHLGQVLFTGTDFVVIDFEGEPARPLSERRLKRCPLRDVAAMLRSFHYAAHTPLVGQVPGVTVRREDAGLAEEWARYWCAWVSFRYLGAYLATMAQSPLLPRRPQDISDLLRTYVLEKAIYELGYELNNRPEWVAVPLRGILQALEPEAVLEA